MSYSSATTAPRSVAFFILFFVCVGLSTFSLLVGGSVNSSYSAQLVGIASNTLFGFLALLLVFYTPIARRFSIPAIVILAALLRFLAVFTEPLLEDDFYRYLWDGLQTFTTGNPYQHAPIDFFPGEGLAQHWQDVLSGINNPDLKTIYGPVLQYLFLLSYLIAPAELWPIQLLLVIVDLVILLTLIRLKVSRPFLLAYAIHPLILQEAIASTHPDILLGGFLLLSILSWRPGRPWITGALLAAACSTKVSAVLIVPFFLLPNGLSSYSNTEVKEKIFATIHWSVKVAFAGVASLALLYAPLISLQHSELESLFVFGQSWRFNPLYFRLIETLLTQLFSNPSVRFLCAMLLILLCVRLILLQWQNKLRVIRFNSTPPIIIALIALLLLSPVVNPWYWLWLLPLAFLLRRKHLVLISCFAPLSYWNSNTLFETGWFIDSAPDASFVVPWSITLIQVAIFTYVIVQEWRLTRPEKHMGSYRSVDIFC